MELCFGVVEYVHICAVHKQARRKSPRAEVLGSYKMLCGGA